MLGKEPRAGGEGRSTAVITPAGRTLWPAPLTLPPPLLCWRPPDADTDNLTCCTDLRQSMSCVRLSAIPMGSAPAREGHEPTTSGVERRASPRGRPRAA